MRFLCCATILSSLIPACQEQATTAPPLLAEVTAELRNHFGEADTDGSGTLSMAEAQARMPGMTDTQFHQLDTNDDGQLSPVEVGLSGGEGEGEGEGETATIPVLYTYTVLDTFPHDTAAFTQGLVYSAGQLYEGTGLVGRSSLRRVDLDTGTVQLQVDLPSPYFGEGIDIWNGRIVQLTWQNQHGFMYQADTFELVLEFSYATEGWGITHDSDEYIMSDGSNVIRFLDPSTLSVSHQIEVYDRGEPVNRLNELEYIGGEIWANVWQTDFIARIDPDTGAVNGWIDLTGLLTESQRQSADVLNGIAYDADTDRILVTGKLWPSIFQISVIPQKRK